MADAADREKAEKLAAAKKKFEQLKKQKGKKAGTKKKDEKPDAEAEASTAPDKTEDANEDNDVTENAGPAPLPYEPAEAAETSTPGHGRTVSISRAKGPISPTAVKSPIDFPLTPSGETAPDIFRKQAQRIEELEKENKRLSAESQDNERRWKKTEEALEELREANGEVAELKSKAGKAEDSAGQVEKLKSEVAGLQRQNAQLQSQATRARRVSTSSPSNPDDLLSQLASKANTIESLELEISNLHAQLLQSSSANTEQANRITSLESSLSKAEHEASSTAHELSDLKANLDRASERAVKEGSSRTSAETRIAQLEAELAAAQRSADNAAKRAETLEKKVETLTTLHREADARHQAKQRDAQKVERDAKELRSRVTFLSNENSRLRDAGERARKISASAGDGGDDGAGVDELVDEERRTLQTRVRELEEEVYDLRQGLWRDRRREMQPGLDEHDAGFDEVALSSTAPHQAGTRRAAGGQQRGGSSFQDVINSGISAFMGTDNRHGPEARPRKESLGLMSDDGDFAFDEDAFRQAQEEEAKRRIERVREIKKKLKDWEGWRVDIVDVRAGMGGVFDM